MAATTATPSRVRPRREREEELLVWPDLVFVEFICAVLFTFTFTILAALVNAPLINRANGNVTPNPSKAPWYFLNLQEMLLHMNPALAGVVMPTVLLLVLAAVPYLDRSTDGQGEWFGTPNAVRISVVSGLVSCFGVIWLILFDSSKHVELYQKITGSKWPEGIDRPSWVPHGFLTAVWDLIFTPDVRSIQTGWKWSINLFGLEGPTGTDHRLTWPADFSRIPLPIINGTWWPKWGGEHGQPPPTWWNHLPHWLTGLYPYDLYINFPANLVEIIIPSMIMFGLPALLLYVLWRVGWLRTRRDVLLSLFTGFIVAYWTMTIIGSLFRGASQELVWPWHVPHIDG